MAARRPRTALPLSAAIAVLLHARSVTAAVELVWDAPASCPTSATVTADVERLLGRALADVDGPVRTAIARVRRESDGTWDLRLWIVDDAGTRDRQLRHRDCARLAEAAATMVVTAIGPVDVDDPISSPPIATPIVPAPDDATQRADAELDATIAAWPTAAAADASAPTIERTPAEPPMQSPRSPPFGAVGLEGVLGWGELPRLGGAIGARVAGQWTHVRLELGGRWWIPRPIRVDTSAQDLGPGVNVQAWTVSPRVCPLGTVKSIEIFGCIGPELGAMRADPVRISHPRTQRVPWITTAASVGVRWVPVPRVAVGVAVEGWVGIVRPRFSIDGLGVVHTARVAGVRGTIDLEVRFGGAIGRRTR
jgi:hypothetical protein